MKKIYVGDNLDALKSFSDESFDLCYIDPPFNSNKNYKVNWGANKEVRTFDDKYDNMDDYLKFMELRIVELHRVLKSTGSFFYHCDWHASHYIKILLDRIFDSKNFQSEIIWVRKSSTASKKSIPSAFDSIFYYTKTSNFFYSQQYKEYSIDYVKKNYRYEDNNGKYRLHDVVANPALGGNSPKYKYKGYTPETRWLISKENLENLDKNGKIVWSNSGRPYRKLYLNEMKGEPISNVWTDINITLGNERIGYPTQKPIALMERILNMSSKEDDTILDAFCGCGTTIIAAEKLNRNWVGIDISNTACKVINNRLINQFKYKNSKDYHMIDVSTQKRSESNTNTNTNIIHMAVNQ